MQIKPERLNELIAMIGDKKIHEWHRFASQKRMTWYEYGQLCLMNFTPPQGTPQKPFTMPDGPAPWNAETFEREMS